MVWFKLCLLWNVLFYTESNDCAVEGVAQLCRFGTFYVGRALKGRASPRLSSSRRNVFFLSSWAVNEGYFWMGRCFYLHHLHHLPFCSYCLISLMPDWGNILENLARSVEATQLTDSGHCEGKDQCGEARGGRRERAPCSFQILFCFLWP